MSSTPMLINISDIHKYTQNGNVNYEIGGFFTHTNNALKFYVTSMGNPQNKNRMFVSLRTHGMIWHTHPPNAGFWPSFEDINRHNYKHILFSKYGVWVFDNNPLKNKKNKVKEMKEMKESYRNFHTFLEETTQVCGWDVHVVQKKIQFFIDTMKKFYGFKIEFIPNWRKNVPKNQIIINRF